VLNVLGLIAFFSVIVFPPFGINSIFGVFIFLMAISEHEKKDRMLLVYWRNSILSNDISENVLILNKYLSKNENDKRDIELEFSLSEEGNSIYKRVFKGY
jgi:hypothetical protein